MGCNNSKNIEEYNSNKYLPRVSKKRVSFIDEQPKIVVRNSNKKKSTLIVDDIVSINNISQRNLKSMKFNINHKEEVISNRRQSKIQKSLIDNSKNIINESNEYS